MRHFRRRIATLALALSALVLAGALLFRLPQVREQVPVRWSVPLRALWSGIHIDDNVRIRAHDGIELAATLLRPKAANTTLPTIYLRSPYDRRTGEGGLGRALFFARHGYAVLVQDVRGKAGSQGAFIPWRHATSDGAATLDWIVAQPWSNGRVGTFGCSALGELQFSLARANHPAHAAMVASGAGGGIGTAASRYGYFGLFEGGIFQLASGFGWFVRHGAASSSAPAPAPFDAWQTLRRLPIRDMVKDVRPGENAFPHYLDNALDSPFWADLDFVMRGDSIDVPAFHINTWGDQTLANTLALAGMSSRVGTDNGDGVRVVIGPGDHCQHEAAGEAHIWGDIALAHADRPYNDWYLAWFDRWLRGNGAGLAHLPPYQFFVVGEDRWLGSTTWPPAGSTPQRWYLSSAGHANSRAGNGVLVPSAASHGGVDRYVYDPMRPVPSRGGPVCCTGDPRVRSGPVDQADVEQRNDVLVYTSAPLDAPLRVAGNVRAQLWVSASTTDTDFVARLVDVGPNGQAINIQEGALRARYRNGVDKPELLRPGAIVPIEIDMRAIAWLLPAGHRLRLDITSSSFPRLERNLNTGGNNATEAKGTIAQVRIHHGAQYPSFVEFDVLQDAAAAAARP